MKLQDGKLYETADGRRFRVTYNSVLNCFQCPKSFSDSWSTTGKAYKVGDDLVREIEEFRWVPVSQENMGHPDGFYRVHRRHLQKQVMRSELVKPKKIPESPLPDSGVIYTIFGPLRWTAKRNEKDLPVFVIDTLRQTKIVKA